MNKVDQYLKIPELIYDIWDAVKAKYNYNIVEFVEVFDSKELRESIIEMVEKRQLPDTIGNNYLNKEYQYVPKLDEDQMSSLTSQVIDKFNFFEGKFVGDGYLTENTYLKIFQGIPNKIAQTKEICQAYQNTEKLEEDSDIFSKIYNYIQNSYQNVYDYYLEVQKNQTEMLTTPSAIIADNESEGYHFWNDTRYYYLTGFVLGTAAVGAGAYYLKNKYYPRVENNLQDIEMVNFNERQVVGEKLENRRLINSRLESISE